MKRNAKFILTITAVFMVGFIEAQDQRPIALNEAIDLSIKNSRQLKISSAKIEEATAALKEAVQKKLPDASVSGAYMRFTAPKIDLKTSNNNGGSGGSTGGSTPKVSQAMYGILNASLPIYAGGRIRYGIESSRLLEEATRLDAENDKQDVIENTVEAYVNLYKAGKAVELVDSNLVEAKQRVRELSSLEKNGLLPLNDLLKAELQESNVELSLLDAQNNWQLANVNMDLLLGLPDKTILVPDSAMLTHNLQPQALDDYIQAAIKNRKDIEALDVRKQAAETGVKATKAEKYPSLALTGGYIVADVPKLLTITNAINIGLGVSYNIASLWKNKAKVEGAEARVKELGATQDLVNDQVRLQVNKAYLNYLSTLKKIDVYAQAISQANEGFRVITNKFNNSLATTTELLDASLARLQANLNYEFAKADAVVAYHQLLKASGQMAQAIK